MQQTKDSIREFLNSKFGSDPDSTRTLNYLFDNDLLCSDHEHFDSKSYSPDNLDFFNSDGKEHLLYHAVSFKIYIPDPVQDPFSFNLTEHMKILREIFTYIRENSAFPLCFCRKGHHSTLIIFNVDSPEYVTDYIQHIHDWILSKFSSETIWGISRAYASSDGCAKAAREAIAATSSITPGIIKQYDDYIIITEDIYFPKVLEYSILISIKSGDLASLDFIIALLLEENFVKRPYDANTIPKINALITNAMSMLNTPVHSFDTYIKSLNAFIEHDDCTFETYFPYLSEIFKIASLTASQKKTAVTRELSTSMLQFVSNNFRDPAFSLAKVAEYFNITEQHTAGIFKEIFGRTLSDYLEELRIKEACILLSNKELTIFEVSEMSGYANLNTFRRAFKRCMGISPNEYRSQNAR